MLCTVTNTSSSAINGLDTYTSGSGVSGVVATGGQRLRPLPFPFGHIGELAAAGTKQLAMHPRDMRHRDVIVGSPLDAGEEWQQMVQDGTVTLAFAAETGRRDQEELLVAAI